MNTIVRKEVFLQSRNCGLNPDPVNNFKTGFCIHQQRIPQIILKQIKPNPDQQVSDISEGD